ncbi:MAG: YraN family protein [Rhodothermales bacterium]
MSKMAKGAGASNKRLGDRGEDLAAVYLENKGYIILARNYRALSAEIDIICRDHSAEMRIAGDNVAGDLVFVEVKTRVSTSHGSPIESITQQKLNHVRRAADHYLFSEGIENTPCRFDVIGIQIIKGKPHIEHLKDVLDY